MKIIEGEKYYSLSEVAEIVGVNISSVRRWIKSGKLKGNKVSRNYYINAAAVKALVSGEPTEPKAKEPVGPVVDSGKTYENLKAAILWVLEERGSTLDVNSISTNNGYEKTEKKIDRLLEKVPKSMLEDDEFGYAYMVIYDNAFKQGYETGYYALLEDLENLIKHDQLDMN